MVNNSRFLLVPHVQVKNLASHVLALAAKRLANDWRKRYGFEPALLETFVEPGRFTGTSYRAVAAAQKQCPQTMLVSMGDREADSYELFHEALSAPENPELLVRAHRVRLLNERQGHWEVFSAARAMASPAPKACGWALSALRISRRHGRL